MSATPSFSPRKQYVVNMELTLLGELKVTIINITTYNHEFKYARIIISIYRWWTAIAKQKHHLCLSEHCMH
jgi:hypothetical protein